MKLTANLVLYCALIAGCSTGSRDLASASATGSPTSRPGCSERTAELRQRLREPHEGPTRAELEASCTGLESVLREVATHGSGWGIERTRAITLLADYPTAETLETLTTLAEGDALASVRRSAVASLGSLQVEDKSRVVSTCATALQKDEDPFVRAAAAQSLGKVGTPEARAALERAAPLEQAGPAREAISKALGVHQ